MRAQPLQQYLTLRPHGLQPARLLCPWHSPGKNTGVGCHFLPQGIFPTQGSNWHLLHCRRILYHWATREARWKSRYLYKPMNFPILTLQPDKGAVFKLTYTMKTLWHNCYFLQNRTTELNASYAEDAFYMHRCKASVYGSSKRKTNRAALAEGCIPDPYSLPSSLKGPCSRLCRHMRSKKQFENQENHLMLKFLINHSLIKMTQKLSASFV